MFAFDSKREPEQTNKNERGRRQAARVAASTAKRQARLEKNKRRRRARRVSTPNEVRQRRRALISHRRQVALESARSHASVSLEIGDPCVHCNAKLFAK